jgi:hypothetical protein
VIARRLAAIAQRNHLSDFPEAQTDGLTGPNEPEPVENFRAIVAIS